MSHWTWPALLRLRSFLKECAPRAILLVYSDRDYDCHPMITFAPLLAKAVLPGCSFVTQFETEYLARNTSLATRLCLKTVSHLLGARRLDYVYGTLLSQSDRIIVLSERHRNRFLESAPWLKDRSLVIPPPPLLQMSSRNGTARAEGRQSLGLKDGDILLAYFGYIYPEKGIETLLRAFQMAASRRENLRLVMIGGAIGLANDAGYLDRLHDLTRELGLGQKVVWSGDYPAGSEAASVLLHAADVCVLPFDHGVTLNRSSLAAATAHGLPVVTSRGESLETPFKDGDNVLLCPPRDPQALASKLAAVIESAELRQRLSAGALKLAEDCFNWKKAVDQTLAALCH